MNPKHKAFIDDWSYFCSRINFGKSALDSRAIVFMNEFGKKLNDVVKEVVTEVKKEVEEKRITGES